MLVLILRMLMRPGTLSMRLKRSCRQKNRDVKVKRIKWKQLYSFMYCEVFEQYCEVRIGEILVKFFFFFVAAHSINLEKKNQTNIPEQKLNKN